MNRVDIGLRVNAESSGFESLNENIRETVEGFSDINGKIHESSEDLEAYNQKVAEHISGGGGLRDAPTAGGSSGGGAFPGPASGTGNAPPGVNDGDEDDDKARERRRGGNYSGSDLLRLEKTLKGAVGGVSRDVGGAAANVAEGLAGQLGQMWNKLPAAGKVLGAGGIAATGAIAIGNELSKQYEAVIPTVMSVTTALGRFGETAKEQSGKFRSTMSEVSDVSAKYGFTLQQGATVVENLARSGTRGDKAMHGAESVLAYSKGYGFTDAKGEFVDLYSSASRYGMSGDKALSYAAGGARRTVGQERVTEYAGAMSQMLEDGLSEGIVKGFDEITGAQNFLYSVFGERAGGQRGSDMYSNLSASVRGATGLQSETDLMLYEATKKGMKEGSTPTDVIMKMERGFDVGTFKTFLDGIRGRGANEEEQRFLVQQAYGVSMTQANDMLKANTDKDINYAYEGSAPGGAIKNTTESELTGHQESISEYMRETGAVVADAKNKILSATDEFGAVLTGKKSLADVMNMEVATANINASDIKIIEMTKDLKEKAKTDKTIDPLTTPIGSVTQNLRNKLDYQYGDILYESEQKGKGDDAKKLNKLLYDSSNWEYILNLGTEKKKKLDDINNMEDGEWTPKELSAVLKMLTDVLRENNTVTQNNTNAQTNASVTVQAPPVRGYDGKGRGAGGR